MLVGQEVRADGATPLLTDQQPRHGVGAGRRLRAGSGARAPRATPVNVRVPAYPGETFPGKVGHIGDVVDPATPHREDPLRRAEPGRPPQARDVREGRAHQRDRPTKVILMPSKAVLTDGDRRAVIVATEGNVFRRASSSRPRGRRQGPRARRPQPGREDRHRRRDLHEARDRERLTIAARDARRVLAAVARCSGRTGTRVRSYSAASPSGGGGGVLWRARWRSAGGRKGC